MLEHGELHTAYSFAFLYRDLLILINKKGTSGAL
jgi:hypothetical protein